MNAFERMGETLKRQTEKTMQSNSTTAMELGVITTGLDLKLTRFDTAIPKGDYLIDKRLAIDYEPDIEVTSSTNNNHTHTVNIPLTQGVSQIKEGDMVLVCWVGVDPIIVAVVVNSNDIGKEM